jgi:hypothetical protein
MLAAIERQRQISETSAGRPLERVRNGAFEAGSYLELLELVRRMAGRQVRVMLVDADRDSDGARIVATYTVGVARIPVGTAYDPALLHLGPWDVDALHAQFHIAI